MRGCLCSVALSLPAVLALSCARHAPPDDSPALSAQPTPSVAAPGTTAFASASATPGATATFLIEKLEVPGHGPAVVVAPVQGGPRPVVIAIHAHATAASYACERWRTVVGTSAFLLCPHGVPATAVEGAPVTVGTAEQTTAEIEAALDALGGRYGDRVDRSRGVLVGYSLGAKIGAQAVERLSSKPGRIVLGEGAYEQVDTSRARRWEGRGVDQVLLLCRTHACELSFAAAAKRLSDEGIATRVVSANTTGHPFDGAVVATARGAWGWLIAGDPRFRTPAAASIPTELPSSGGSP